jgi:hypothetical protein
MRGFKLEAVRLTSGSDDYDAFVEDLTEGIADEKSASSRKPSM